MAPKSPSRCDGSGCRKNPNPSPVVVVQTIGGRRRALCAACLKVQDDAFVSRQTWANDRQKMIVRDLLAFARGEIEIGETVLGKVVQS